MVMNVSLLLFNNFHTSNPSSPWALQNKKNFYYIEEIQVTAPPPPHHAAVASQKGGCRCICWWWNLLSFSCNHQMATWLYRILRI
jgi:hypothetical protein